VITRVFDRETGILRVIATGTWAPEDVDAHYTALREMIAPIRRTGARVRLLSDVTRAARQSPELEARILEQMEHTFQPGDRVALLTATVDDKMHARDLLRDVEIAVFNSAIPAELWLMTDDLPKIG
jgi:hypothetical protein